MDDALRKGEKTAQDAGHPADRCLGLGGFGVVFGCRSRADVLALLPLDGVAVAHHPEIDVGFRVLGKPVAQPSLAADLNDRAIDVLVPVGYSLAIGHGFVADGGQPVAVSLNVSPDLIVAAKRRGPDIVVRMEAIEIGTAQKFGVLSLQQKLIGGHACVERGTNVTFDHLRVDELLAPLTSDANSMVAILDEVDVTDLVELDRRQMDVLIVGAVDVLPATRGKALAGENSRLKS